MIGKHIDISQLLSWLTWLLWVRVSTYSYHVLSVSIDLETSIHLANIISSGKMHIQQQPN